jgi:signal transduction histidine kinase
MHFPKVVAAQRLQMWLLVGALGAVLFIGLMMVELARNLRTAVIGETRETLTNVVEELSRASDIGLRAPKDPISSAWLDKRLEPVSYAILRSYLDIEGGYLWNEQVVGHSFPTYTEPGSKLGQPDVEYQGLLSALAESRRTGHVAYRVVQDHKDLVLVSVLAGKNEDLSAWSLRRLFNFSQSHELTNDLLLAGIMVMALAAIGFVLRLSFSMQHGFDVIQAGLERLRTEPGFRIPDQDHELRSIVKAINNMAESREKLENDLRREDRLRVMGRVVAGIAHEIRNPLNSIRLTIRVLARHLQGNSPAEESTAVITREIDRLDSLLNSLLVFRADEPARLRTQLLQPIVERTMALVKPHAQENGVTLHLDGLVGCEALTDGERLQQVLMNLLLNAIDASRPGGDVFLRVKAGDGHTEIEVQDSGTGLDAEQQERIFESFYTTKTAGTGLGLAVTKTLLERMDATIEAENGRSGALFRVRLASGN